MSASAVDRRRVAAVEKALDAQILLGEVGRLDAAEDIRRGRVEQLLGEAQQQLVTIGRLDQLEDDARAKLAASLRALAGELDGVEAAAR